MLLSTGIQIRRFRLPSNRIFLSKLEGSPFTLSLSVVHRKWVVRRITKTRHEIIFIKWLGTGIKNHHQRHHHVSRSTCAHLSERLSGDTFLLFFSFRLFLKGSSSISSRSSRCDNIRYTDKTYFVVGSQRLK